MTVALFLLGIGLLVSGADLLVRGASRLAIAAGISPLVVGLTVVAYGTSAPEVAVSVRASFLGQADLAYGNVVGSNVFNVLVVLGLSAAIAPLLVDRQLVRRDVPIMVGVSVLTMLLALDGSIGRLDGLLLFGGAFSYTAFSIAASRREGRSAGTPAGETTAPSSPKKTWPVDVVFVLAGVGLLVLGARWLVEGAVAMARSLGVSELVVGLTIVAAGTSLPEVATSVLAAIRGEREIAVGNVVGSNIFNILAVLGLTGLVAPAGVPIPAAALRFDTPVMIAVAFACLPIFITGHVVDRWEGGLFLATYVFYTAYVVLKATGSPRLAAYERAMVTFVLPLTAVTLAVLAGKALRQRRAGAGA